MKEKIGGGAAQSRSCERHTLLTRNLTAYKSLAALQNRYGHGRIAPFSDVFLIFSWWKFRKEDAWKILREWEQDGRVQIIAGHGIRLCHKMQYFHEREGHT